jgi:hypothetical protein
MSMNRKMNTAETNACLGMLETQFHNLTNALDDMDRRGDLNDKSYEIFRRLKIELVNLESEFSEVRGWNSSNTNLRTKW